MTNILLILYINYIRYNFVSYGKARKNLFELSLVIYDIEDEIKDELYDLVNLLYIEKNSQF